MQKDLVSALDLSAVDVREILDLADAMKAGRARPQLPGKTLALLFEKPSLRTRVSFDVGMYQLGGHCVYLSPAEVSLGERESIRDAAEVLSRYVDGIAARAFAHSTVVELACHARVPVINALSAEEHPGQALADFQTIRERRGDPKGLKVAFIGDGNNCAVSLMYIAALLGAHFSIASPHDYELPRAYVERAQAVAANSGATITLTDDPMAAARDADAVYTDVWTSMGWEEEQTQRQRAFADFQVNFQLLDAARPEAILLHPLPAHHGEEVAEGVLYDPRSAVFDQAENRLHVNKAVLALLMDNQTKEIKRD